MDQRPVFLSQLRAKQQSFAPTGANEEMTDQTPHSKKIQ